jgi:hypothetical protein
MFTHVDYRVNYQKVNLKEVFDRKEIYAMFMLYSVYDFHVNIVIIFQVRDILFSYGNIFITCYFYSVKYVVIFLNHCIQWQFFLVLQIVQ